MIESYEVASQLFTHLKTKKRSNITLYYRDI